MTRFAFVCLCLVGCAGSTSTPTDLDAALDATADGAVNAADAAVTPLDASTPPDALVDARADGAIDGATADAAPDATLSPSALCLVDRMTTIYSGILPTNPYAAQPDATECIASAHDVIMVLGCPNNDDGSPAACQIERADIAVALSEAGYGDWFITSGASVHSEGVEADTLAQLLIDRGISSDRILREPLAAHTDENIYYSDVIMAAHGWTTALVVSDDPGHLIMSAVCDSNCCVKRGRLTIFDFPVSGGSHVAGHYVRVPPGMEVSTAECNQIKGITKAMCTSLSSRLACADDFRL